MSSTHYDNTIVKTDDFLAKLYAGTEDACHCQKRLIVIPLHGEHGRLPFYSDRRDRHGISRTESSFFAYSDLFAEKHGDIVAALKQALHQKNIHARHLPPFVLQVRSTGEYPPKAIGASLVGLGTSLFRRFSIKNSTSDRDVPANFRKEMKAISRAAMLAPACIGYSCQRVGCRAGYDVQVAPADGYMKGKPSAHSELIGKPWIYGSTRNLEARGMVDR